MRRLLIICLMLLLPTQWTWAAAAAVCAHEAGGSHIGHHEHKHSHPGDLTGEPASATSGASAMPDPPTDAADPVKPHSDCASCHVTCALHLGVQGAQQPAYGADSLRSPYGAFVADPPVERFLRPPLTLVA